MNTNFPLFRAVWTPPSKDEDVQDVPVIAVDLKEQLVLIVTRGKILRTVPMTQIAFSRLE